jgi:hypothetical protein
VDELVALLCLPDSQIAHTLGRFEWGVPMVEVPRLVSAVARTNELTTLTNLFTESVTGRNPKVAILTGNDKLRKEHYRCRLLPPQ